MPLHRLAVHLCVSLAAAGQAVTTRTERDKLGELAELLHFRGIVVTRDLLRERTDQERNAAAVWSLTRARASSCPAWLVSLLDRHKAVRLRGICRDCACTDDEACLGGCSWVDLTHTLCSRCIP